MSLDSEEIKACRVGLIWEAVFGGRGRGGRKGWWREWGRSVVEEFGEDDDVALSVTWMMR